MAGWIAMIVKDVLGGMNTHASLASGKSKQAQITPKDQVIQKRDYPALNPADVAAKAASVAKGAAPLLDGLGTPEGAAGAEVDPFADPALNPPPMGEPMDEPIIPPPPPQPNPQYGAEPLMGPTQDAYNQYVGAAQAEGDQMGRRAMSGPELEAYLQSLLNRGATQ